MFRLQCGKDAINVRGVIYTPRTDRADALAHVDNTVIILENPNIDLEVWEPVSYIELRM